MHMPSCQATVDTLVHHPSGSKWKAVHHPSSTRGFKFSCIATGEGLEDRQWKDSLQHYLLPVTAYVNG